SHWRSSSSLLVIAPPPSSTLFPYTTLFRSLAPPLVLGAHLPDEGRALRGRRERLTHADRARGILHIHHRARVLRRDLHRGVRRRSGGAADQQRQLEALPLHLLRHVHHLIERRRDESRQADEIRLLAPGGLEDLLARHHDAEVDDLEVVTLKHYADDVLADVVDVALHRGHDDAPVGAARSAVLALLDEGHEVRHRALHHARALHDLRQEHLAAAEE